MDDHPLQILSSANIGILNGPIAGRDILEQQGSINVLGDHNHVRHTVIQGNPHSGDPIERLLFHSAPDALLNSRERFDAPRCSPETRTAICQQIVDWVQLGPKSPEFLWLTGSAGSGKSAICQTTAENFKGNEALFGTFFFSRAGGVAGRSNGDRLLPTLVWQMQRAFPETRHLIQEAVRDGALGVILADQIQSLFCNPLKSILNQHYCTEPEGRQLRLIVIDGLDECEGIDAQLNILRSFAEEVSRLEIPLRFLIASRPEAHIVHAFNNHPSLKAVTICINLDQDRNGKDSIARFVCDKFHDIRTSHPLREHLPPTWPSEADIDFIVSNSTPQFIFASTVMKYIQSHDGRPDLRLEEIQGSKAGNLPSNASTRTQFEDLDDLYQFIFKSIAVINLPKIQITLSIIHHASRTNPLFPVPKPSLEVLETLLDVPKGMVNILLKPLASLITIPSNRQQPVRSLHTSLFDFLINRQRSQAFWLDLRMGHAESLRYFIVRFCQGVRGSHPLGRHLSPSWPSKDDIDFLVSKSMAVGLDYGLVIMEYIAYPDVAISLKRKFPHVLWTMEKPLFNNENASIWVGDHPEEARPDFRLQKVILKAKSYMDASSAKRTQDLDIVYRFILSKVRLEDIYIVSKILAVVIEGGHDAGSAGALKFYMIEHFFEKTFDLDITEVENKLAPLASLITCTNLYEGIEYLFTIPILSFVDFLLDAHRSREFAVDLGAARQSLTDFDNIFDDLSQSIKKLHF